MRSPAPRRRFGQHFLEPAWAAKVLRAIDPHPSDTFLEIGSGRGALTRSLSERAARLVAIEIDRDLAVLLRAAALPRLTLIEGDVLRVSADRVRELTGGPFRVAGNLPYNVAAPILFELVEWYAAGLGLRDATVMLQREVADRLTASPGTRDYGVLTILIRLWADVDIRLQLPAGAFRPPPKVQSTVVRLRFRPPDPAPADPVLFGRVVSRVFTRRRKTLANALLAVTPAPATIAGALRAAAIDGRRRPETLSIAEMVALVDAMVLTRTG